MCQLIGKDFHELRWWVHVFWVIALRSLLSLYRCFRGTHLLDLQGAFVLKMEMEFKNIFSGSELNHMVQSIQHFGNIRTLMMQMESVLERLFDLCQLT